MNGQRIIERHVDGSADVVTEVPTVIDVVGAHLNLTARRGQRRIDRHIFEDPAQAASAIERPLRPTQYLDALQIAWVEVSYLLTARDSRRRTKRHVVDRDAYTWIDETTRSDAAN